MEYTRPLTAHEQAMKDRGYPNASTATLKPGARLGNHAHNSRNNHYIVSGELTLWLVELIASNTRQIYINGEPVQVPSHATTFKKGDWAPVEAGACYAAIAGSDGCTFVEGHKVLSPATASRYERGGTLRKTKSKSGTHVSNAAPLHCPLESDLTKRLEGLLEIFEAIYWALILILISYLIGRWFGLFDSTSTPVRPGNIDL